VNATDTTVVIPKGIQITQRLGPIQPVEPVWLPWNGHITI
jgi:hypothetical protein